MKQFWAFLLSMAIVACTGKTQQAKNSSVDTIIPKGNTTYQARVRVVSSHGINKNHEFSGKSKFLYVTGYFNDDKILDTAMLISRKISGNHALLIKHGGTGQSFLFKDGKNLNTGFKDFNWVGHLGVVRKGTKIWNNVIGGEIVSEHQVPEGRKIILKTNGILLQEDEGGGGIIYFKNKKYIWVQQD